MSSDDVHPQQTEQQDEAARARSAGLSLRTAPPGYELIEPLGRGAFGEVWKARQTSTGKDVAIKAFVRFHGLDWQFLRMEVQRLVELDAHPHIVSLLDAQLEREPPSYVMELVRGGSLGGVLRSDAAIPTGRAVQWITQIAEALAYVHDKGVLHCDLKPDNILVDEHNAVRLVDFGQSRLVTDASSALGTLMYMAPEQAVLTDVPAARHADVRWDVYALGATAYILLTGSALHDSPEHRARLAAAQSLQERLGVYRRIVETEPLPAHISSKNGRPIDEDLASIVRMCLAPNPDDRYASMSDVVLDLLRRRTHYPVAARKGGFAYRTRKLILRRTARVVTALSLLVIAGGTGVGLWWRALEREAESITKQYELEMTERLDEAINRGNQFLQQKQWTQAEFAFKEALDIAPDDYVALANLGRVYQLRAEEPGENWDQLLGQAYTAVERALEEEPGDLQLLHQLAALQFQRHAYAESSLLFEQVVNQEPDYYPAFVNLAHARAHAGDLDAALSAARSAVAICDQQIDAMQVGEPGESVESPEIADTRRRCYNAYQTLGTLLLIKRDDAAIDYFIRSIKCDPMQSDVRLKLARARLTLESKRDPSLARDDVTVALSNPSEDQTLLKPRAQRLRALAALQTGQLEVAIDLAQQAIDTGDFAPPNFLTIACARMKQGDAEAAERRVQQATDACPHEFRGARRFTIDDDFWFESFDELQWLSQSCELPAVGTNPAP